MRIFSVLLLLALIASAAVAVVDPDADQMGLYFDPAGDTVCATAVSTGMVPLYVIYTNPTLTEVRGFECSVTKDGPGAQLLFPVDTEYPIDARNIATHAGDVMHYIVGYGEPLPTAAATVLATLQFLVVQPDAVELYLGPAQPASLDSPLPVVLAGDYSLLPVGISAPFGPSALLNSPECDVVDMDPTPWGAVKALYHADSRGEVSR